ncbi:hypothetical protein SCHPADRAFT_163130 [Schizopora paradoxa]|uniref:WD40 repeat-like protein n=1 Tax=Schizopora paradoxa TaxID=27342 RepID=A0A0H2SK76_9AGAM|nr:hypothetical protein SCHPADRAFT_163130 [Schizopora paradoxa]
MTMRKVVSSTPLNAQPWYITFWIRQSYAALLVIAVIMYVLGLGIYVIKTQHVVAAVIPCVLGGACAIGVSIVSWRHVRDILVNWWRSRHEKVTKEGEESDDAFMKHLDQVIVDNNNAELFREFFPMEDDESSIDEKVQLEEEQLPEEMERYNPHLSRAYINYLQHVRQGAKSGLFSDFKRGRIEHMRCSPDGRWLVVCYELACLVYDVKNNFEYQNLTQEDAQQSAEHAEWSPTGEYLLTRTKKELRLWKTPLGVPGAEENKFELLKKRFGLPGGQYRYIKWVNRDDFLLLTDGADIFFVNRERGLREVNRLAVPDDFKVTQVFPLTPRFDTILCLAKKKVEIDDTKGEADSEGVDYLLVLSKGQTLLGKILRRVRIGASDGGTRLQRSDYVLNQKKLLHRNVTNVKICRNNQFILINYDGNEVRALTRLEHQL